MGSLHEDSSRLHLSFSLMIQLCSPTRSMINLSYENNDMLSPVSPSSESLSVCVCVCGGWGGGPGNPSTETYITGLL